MKSLINVHFSKSVCRMANVPPPVRKSKIPLKIDGISRASGAIIAGIKGVLAGLLPQPKLVPIPVIIPASQSSHGNSNARRFGSKR